MTKKDQSASKKKDVKATASSKITDRQQLLARVAGDVASGVVASLPLSSPSESASSVEGVATIAVDIAEAILQKIGA